MFPRPLEWWALPRMAEEFTEWGIPQYWDEELRVSLEVKERVVPDGCSALVLRLPAPIRWNR